MSRNLLIAALSLGSAAASSQAATFTLSNTYLLQNTNAVVGTGTFTYDAPTVLADGNYSWSSFVNPTISIFFTNTGSSFTQADFNGSTTYLGVQIVSNQFYFTANSTGSGIGVMTYGGSADFENAQYDQLSHDPNLGYYSVFTYDTMFSGPFPISSAPPVPEPSTYGLILGGLALAGAAIRRRKSAK